MGRALLVCRSGDDDFLAGREELPSGGVDDGESIDEGRVRELQEEIGLGEHRVDDGFVGLFDYTDGRGRLTRQFTFSIPWLDGEPRLSPEHSSYRWIDRVQLDTADVTAETREVLAQWWTWHAETARSGVV
jgi:8-oxo-dGTP pyrophosphatase MutT (NUDIX family)